MSKKAAQKNMNEVLFRFIDEPKSCPEETIQKFIDFEDNHRIGFGRGGLEALVSFNWLFFQTTIFMT